MNSPTKSTESKESTDQGVGASREDLARVITDAAKPDESAETEKGPFSRLCEDHNRKKEELAKTKSAIQTALRETLLKGLKGVDFVSHQTIYSRPSHPDFRDLEMGDGKGLIIFYLGKTLGKLSESEEESIAGWLLRHTRNGLLRFRFLGKEGILKCEVPVSVIDRLLARAEKDKSK